MSGFRRDEPSDVTGPRLLNAANVLLLSYAPTENTSASRAGGAVRLLQAGP